jgi:hypothetical protein
LNRALPIRGIDARPGILKFPALGTAVRFVAPMRKLVTP